MKKPTKLTITILCSIIKNFEEILCGILFIVLIFVVGLQIVFRYLLNNPLPWPEELAGYLLVWLTMIGAAGAIKRNAHTYIEFLTGRVGEKVKTGLFILSFILMSLLLWILIITGYIVAKETNFPTVTLPFSWTLVYISVPFSALLMFIRLFWITYKRITTERIFRFGEGSE